jgi:hypothetical protein
MLNLPRQIPMRPLKALLFLFLGTTHVSASFDLQHSWLRELIVEAEGVVAEPPIHRSQTITGDPESIYSETYEESKFGFGHEGMNLASLRFSLGTRSSETGVVEAFTFESEILAETFERREASADLTFESVVNFRTNTSFSLLAALLNSIGGLDEFSLWVDDTLLWSFDSGIHPFDNSDPLSTRKFNDSWSGTGPDFIVAMETPRYNERLGSSVRLNVIFDPNASLHNFEVRTAWSAAQNGSSSANYVFSLQAQVPECSQLSVYLLALAAPLLMRRRGPR